MGADEDEVERSLKLALVDIYNKGLTEREKRKRYVRCVHSTSMCIFIVSFPSALLNSTVSLQGSRDSVVGSSPGFQCSPECIGPGLQCSPECIGPGFQCSPECIGPGFQCSPECIGPGFQHLYTHSVLLSVCVLCSSEEKVVKGGEVRR